MANVSRDIYDEALGYLQVIAQQGVPVVDADLNDGSDIQLQLFRRLVRDAFGDGSPVGNVGFKIKGDGSNNDITFEGNGGGSIVDRGVCYLGGLPALLVSDITYKQNPNSAGGEGGDEIHAKSTAQTDSLLTDNTADFTFGTGTANLLAGRFLNPDIAQGNSIIITENTATTITVASGLDAFGSPGDHYRIEMSTPGGSRTDNVYLDVFMREVDTDEDTNLLHNLGTSVEAFIRKKVDKRIYIDQGQVSSNNWKNTEKKNDTGLDRAYRWTDSNGAEHFVMKIAEISRTATDVINDPDVADLRPSRFGHARDVISKTAYQATVADAGYMSLIHNLEMGLENLEVVAFFRSAGKWARINTFDSTLTDDYYISEVSGNENNSIRIQNNTGGSKELLLYVFPTGSPRQNFVEFATEGSGTAGPGGTGGKVITHNLGKIPKFIFLDSTNVEVSPLEIEYSTTADGALSLNVAIVRFTSDQIGKLFFE